MRDQQRLFNIPLIYAFQLHPEKGTPACLYIRKPVYSLSNAVCSNRTEAICYESHILATLILFQKQNLRKHHLVPNRSTRTIFDCIKFLFHIYLESNLQRWIKLCRPLNLSGNFRRIVYALSNAAPSRIEKVIKHIYNNFCERELIFKM